MNNLENGWKLLKKLMKMNKIFQGNVAQDGSTKIICNGSSFVINMIVINNKNTNYTIEVSKFLQGVGIHEIPIYKFNLNAGDTIRDTDQYILNTNEFIQLITNVPGTTYYINTTEV